MIKTSAWPVPCQWAFKGRPLCSRTMEHKLGEKTGDRVSKVWQLATQ